MQKRAFHIFALLVFMASNFAVIRAQSGGEAELADKYFKSGEYENALQLYDKLQKKEQANRHFNTRIAECYRQLEQYSEAVQFMEKTVKKNPTEFIYPFILADLYRLEGKFKEADELEDETINKSLKLEFEFSEIGNWLYSTGKTELAKKTFLQARKRLKSEYLFPMELARLYSLDGEYAVATEELLKIYTMQPGELLTVRTEILNLVNEDSKDKVEEVLLSAVSKRSNDLGLRNIVFDFYVFTENFYEAFVQVKSIDKVFKENGLSVFKFAMTMRNNKNYKLSNKALDFIIEEHQSSPYYLKAFQEKAVNGELIAFESIPLDTTGIRDAVEAYSGLLDQFGRKAQFFDAMYRKARLQAFYLFELDAGLEELEKVIMLPIKPIEVAEAKLLMGDILLMKKDYNQASARYDEVAEAFHEGQTGALAKYKQGRLSYFKGDFEYSKARLKTIKDNTSNDISNDAIRLFLVIQDNSGLDSTTTALEQFAQAQLMVFQRDFDPALKLLDSILYEFPNHGLTDEILWEKSNIYLQKNDHEMALKFLDQVINDYGEDIYGDDALYTKARIYDYTFKNKETAMELYIEFLMKYSGSLYVVEVRKRIRELRNENL